MFRSVAARWLWTLLLIHGVLVTGVLLMTGSPESDTIIRPAQFFLDVVVQQNDSWRPMQAAQEYLEKPHDQPVYDALLIDRGVKFQYPLSSLLFTRHLSTATLNVIGWWSIVMVLLATWLTLWKSSRRTVFQFDLSDVMVGLAVIGLGLTFYPLLKGFALGQIQAWITAAVALGILALLWGREDVAGLAIGVACLIKPTYLLVVVWAAVRRRWTFLAPVLGVVLLGSAAAWLVYGLTDNANYLHALSIIGRQGETFFPNQSVNGLLNRLMGNGDSLKFDRASFAPFHPIVYAGTLGAFLILTALALWLPRRSPRAGSAFDLSLFLLAVTITAPVAWDHHYGLVLPVLAASAPLILMVRPLGRWTIPVLTGTYVAVGQSILVTNRLAGTWLGVFQSYQFLGALTLLGLMFATLLRDRPAADSRT